MNAVVTQALTRRFGQRTAVDSLSLTIGQGEFFSLLGQNGAGKTTAIRMLSCLLRPTSGDALLMGKSVVREPGEVKRLLNVSPQETAVARNLTVRENLELIAGIYGRDRRESRRRAGEMMELFQVTDRAGDRAKALSGGLQRRLSIAMALISEPSILFLDEPTLGLDVRARRDLWTLIRALKGKVTVLLTTHYLEEAEALSDRIGIMHGGRLLCDGSVEEIKSQTGSPSLEEAFLKLTEEGDAL